MKNSLLKPALLALAIVLAVLLAWQRHRVDWSENEQIIQITADTSADLRPDSEPESPVVPTPSATETAAVQAKNTRRLPFASQAPTGVWDAWHEEMCEEASMILAWRYWLADNQVQISPDQMESWLQAVAAFERERFGTDTSTTITDAKETMVDFYQIPSSNLEITAINTISDLQQAVDRGLVIAPFAGKMLQNPHFKNGGPRYHMSVIISHSGEDFVVHDVGTKFGAYYHYSGSVLLAALHDFVPENEGDITTGSPNILILTK